MIHLSGNLVCIDCHDPEMARWQAEACERVSRYGVSVAPGERAGTRAIVPHVRLGPSSAAGEEGRPWP